MYLAGLLAGASIGLGWVLQQRVAIRAPRRDLLRPRLLLHLVRQPLWCLGIAAMLAGNMLWVWTLYLGTVSQVEPLLSSSLVFAFLFSAALARHAPRGAALLGALLVSAALSGFVAIADARADDHTRPGLGGVAMACLLVAILAGALVLAGRRRGLRGAAVLFACAAGTLYGLQDAAARWALVDADRRGVLALFSSSGSYVVLVTALGGLLLSQSAFGSDRLENSLPPMAVAEPTVGIALGVALLGDTVAHGPLALFGEAVCLVAMVLGALLIGRSGVLRGAVPGTPPASGAGPLSAPPPRPFPAAPSSTR